MIPYANPVPPLSWCGRTAVRVRSDRGVNLLT
jgi:hypothetical protein